MKPRGQARIRLPYTADAQVIRLVFAVLPCKNPIVLRGLPSSHRFLFTASGQSTDDYLCGITTPPEQPDSCTNDINIALDDFLELNTNRNTLNTVNTVMPPQSVVTEPSMESMRTWANCVMNTSTSPLDASTMMSPQSNPPCSPYSNNNNNNNNNNNKNKIHNHNYTGNAIQITNTESAIIANNHKNNTTNNMMMDMSSTSAMAIIDEIFSSNSNSSSSICSSNCNEHNGSICNNDDNPYTDDNDEDQLTLEDLDELLTEFAQPSQLHCSNNSITTTPDSLVGIQQCYSIDTIADHYYQVDSLAPEVSQFDMTPIDTVTQYQVDQIGQQQQQQQMEISQENNNSNFMTPLVVTNQQINIISNPRVVYQVPVNIIHNVDLQEVVDDNVSSHIYLEKSFSNSLKRPFDVADEDSKDDTAVVDPVPNERKKRKAERKKVQNKEAARRYRDKKKNEFDGVNSELGGLEDENEKLRRKLKELLTEKQIFMKLWTECVDINANPKMKVIFPSWYKPSSKLSS